MNPAYIVKVVEGRRDVSQICTVRSILELVFIGAGHFVFSDMRHSTGLCLNLDARLRLLFSFFVLVNFHSLFLCVPCVRFYNRVTGSCTKCNSPIYQHSPMRDLYFSMS